MVVFPVPAIPLNQYILVSPASAAQAIRSAKIFSLVFTVQERRPARDFCVICCAFCLGKVVQQCILEKSIKLEKKKKTVASRHQLTERIVCVVVLISMRSSPNFMRISPNFECNIHLSLSMT